MFDQVCSRFLRTKRFGVRVRQDKETTPHPISSANATWIAQVPSADATSARALENPVVPRDLSSSSPTFPLIAFCVLSIRPDCLTITRAAAPSFVLPASHSSLSILSPLPYRSRHYSITGFYRSKRGEDPTQALRSLNTEVTQGDFLLYGSSVIF